MTDTAAPRRRRRRALAIGIPIAAAALAALIAWPVASAAETHTLILSTDARPLVCAKGQEVVQNVDGAYTELARLTPKLDCTFRIHLYNGGSLPVQLDNAAYQGLGPRSLTAHVDFIDGLPSRGGTAQDALGRLSDDGDATGPIQADIVLAPGQTFTLTAHVEPSKQTCYYAGGGVIFSGSNVAIGVSVLGIPQTRDGTAVRFGFQGTTESTSASCGK